MRKYFPVKMVGIPPPPCGKEWRSDREYPLLHHVGQSYEGVRVCRYWLLWRSCVDLVNER